MSNINELKEKFEKAQKINQELKESKIRIESEIKTLTNDYNEHVKALLDITGKDSLESAVQYYQELKEQLEQEKTSLESQLDEYLKTYTENSNGVEL